MDESKYKFRTIFSENKCPVDYTNTLGVHISTRKIKVVNQSFKIILAKLSGHERQFQIRKSSYRHSYACIILFDKQARASFNDISKWYEEFRQYTHSPQLPIAVVGITSNSEEVSTEEAQALIGQLPNCTYFDCTLTNRIELDAVVEHLVREVLKLHPKSM